jgi:RHS repeat-associated protein
MRRALFFIVVLCLATSSFASIPRASMPDRASEYASTFAQPLPETRVWASDVLAPFEHQSTSELTRALHQAYGDSSTTNASGLGRFLSVDPVLKVKRAVHRPQLWNRYSYALNNPLIFTDPSGQTVYLVTYSTGNVRGDDDLRRAAETRAASIQNGKGFDSKKDKVILRGVGSMDDFKAAVKEANGYAGKQYGGVGEVSLFSHAGKYDGPYLHDAKGNEQYFSTKGLSSMSVMWEAGGCARFFSCNSARSGFTQKFADTQGVSTYGLGGYSYFSSDPNERVDYGSSYSGPVYMMHAMGSHNLPFLGGVIPWFVDPDANPMVRADPND